MAKAKVQPEAKEPEETKMEETVKPAKEEKTKKYTLPQVMYIGPSVKGVISKNYIYLNGMPEDVINKLKAKTGLAGGLVSALFIPVEDLNDAKEKLKNPDSKLSICYKKLAETGGK
jgi:hypothetical protein